MRAKWTVEIIDDADEICSGMPWDFESKAAAVSWCKEAANDRQRWVQHAESESWADAIVSFGVFKDDELIVEIYAKWNQ